MGTITKSEVISIADKLTAIYLTMAGGDPATQIDDLQAILLGTEDYGVIGGGFADAIEALKSSIAHANIVADRLRGVMSVLDAKCAAVGISGVTNLNSYAAYYNTGAGGPYTCLLPPSFYDLFLAVKKSAPSPYSLYAAAASAIGAKTVGSSFVDGAAVDSTKFAGFARAQVTGSSIVGSGVVTVTGIGRNSAGVVGSGKVWTATVNADASFNLTPAVTGDILIDVTDITIAAGITGGTVTVNGLIPSGRTNPPV